MCLIIFGLSLSVSLGPLSGWCTALIAAYSAFSIFHKSYRIKASFGINMNSNLFDRIEINFINNGKMNYITEFEGIIPSTRCIAYDYKSFGRKRIKDVTDQISYDKGDSNYNDSYVKYFGKIEMIPSHSTMSRNIVVPLTDIIKIVKVNEDWERIVRYEIIHKRKIIFVVLFNDYKRKAIPGVIQIDPMRDLYSRNTYNFMISKMFDRKTLKDILLKQDKQIKKENVVAKDNIKESIIRMRILP